MKAALWLMALSCGLYAAGCSVPDDPNYDEVVAGIHGLPASSRLDARRWAANRRAAEHFAGRDKDEPVITVMCGNPYDGWRRVFTPRDFLRCLDLGSGVDGGNKSFQNCVGDLYREAKAEYVKETGREPEQGCSTRYEDGYTTGDRDPAWDPEHETDDDVARELVKTDELPKWLPIAIIGGVIVAVFAPEFLPALCTLQNGSGPACPSSPAYPPGNTPQPAQPGGDR